VIVLLLVPAALIWTLARMRQRALKGVQPEWFVLASGIAAWVLVASLGWSAFTIGNLIVSMMTIGVRRGAEILATLMGIFMYIALYIKVRQSSDSMYINDFLMSSLLFTPFNAPGKDIFEELERQEIRKIHRETTGRDVDEMIEKKKPIPHTETEQARKEIERLRAQPVRPAHFDSEIRQLQAGEEVEVSDLLLYLASKKPRHDLYRHCSNARISPPKKTMSLSVQFPSLLAGIELNADRLHRAKQDLYEFLQAFNTEEALKPYRPFFSAFDVTCSRVEADSFDLPAKIPFMTIEIDAAELRKRENSFFSVADLHTIARVTMQEKKP